MDRFDRIYALHKELYNARYPVSGRVLQQRLECSRATLNRSTRLSRRVRIETS